MSSSLKETVVTVPHADSASAAAKASHDGLNAGRFIRATLSVEGQDRLVSLPAIRIISVIFSSS